jgi:hypothetical protein
MACTWETSVACSAPAPTCAAPLDAPAGEHVSVSASNFGIGVGPLDLGACSGDPDAAGQVVVRYVVPGAGPREVRFSTANDGTDPLFDTLVQVRRDCAVIPPSLNTSCFDYGPGTFDRRAAGGVEATGGETLFFVVTGYGPHSRPLPGGLLSEGPFQLDIDVADVSIPVLSEARVLQVTSGTTPTALIPLRGMDAGGDVLNVWVRLLDASDARIDRNGDGTIDTYDDQNETVVAARSGATTFDTSIRSEWIGGSIADTGATRARIWIDDVLGHESNAITVDIATVAEVGFHETCDATHLCEIGRAHV